MKCYNCEHLLPDDSEFCQYCGKKIINELPLQDNADEKNIVEPIGISEDIDVNSTNVKKAAVQVISRAVVKKPLIETVDASQENNIKKKYRTKFCKLCGGQIDDHTKKCSGCGKQYFKGIKLNKFSIVVLILSLVAISSIILNIVQTVEMNKLNEDKEYYKQKLEEQQTQISNLNKEIKEKGNDLEFYQEYAVIVNDNSKKYHLHGCSDLGNSSFMIYNVSQAKNLGYSECAKCYEKDQKKPLTIGEINKKYGTSLGK